MNKITIASPDNINPDTENYSGYIETLYLSSIPGMKEQLVEGLKEPLDNAIPDEKVEW